MNAADNMYLHFTMLQRAAEYMFLCAVLTSPVHINILMTSPAAVLQLIHTRIQYCTPGLSANAHRLQRLYVALLHFNTAYNLSIKIIYLHCIQNMLK